MDIEEPDIQFDDVAFPLSPESPSLEMHNPLFYSSIDMEHEENEVLHPSLEMNNPFLNWKRRWLLTDTKIR